MRPTISSAEFRRTYTKLTEATVVTVNGHPIGLWEPANGPWDDVVIVPGRGGEADTILERSGVYRISADIPRVAPPDKPRTHTGHRDREGKRAARELRTAPLPHTPTVIEGIPKTVTTPRYTSRQAERDAILRKVNRGKG